MNKYKKTIEEFLAWADRYGDNSACYKMWTLIKTNKCKIDYEYKRK